MSKEEAKKNFEMTITVPERLQLIGFLNSFRDVPYETLVEVWRIMDKVKFTEEEKKTIEMRDVIGKDANGQDATISIKWNDKKVEPLGIELTLDERKVIKERFESLSKDNKLSADLYQLAQVYEKIK
jgi:hypothetical protein